jgi:hypothetical protein
MSRPLRIEYPDAWYHVMNRGRRGENVFADEKDYCEFLALLHEASKMFGLPPHQGVSLKVKVLLEPGRRLTGVIG